MESSRSFSLFSRVSSYSSRLPKMIGNLTLGVARFILRRIGVPILDHCEPDLRDMIGHTSAQGHQPPHHLLLKAPLTPHRVIRTNMTLGVPLPRFHRRRPPLRRFQPRHPVGHVSAFRLISSQTPLIRCDTSYIIKFDERIGFMTRPRRDPSVLTRQPESLVPFRENRCCSHFMIVSTIRMARL